jgi:formate dehydrogenase maturation protein FdhE
MAALEKQFEELDEEELKKKLCLRCLAFGFSIKKSLYNEKEMKSSPATNDLICSNCYDLEIEQQGHKRIPRGEINYAGRIMRAFEEYKNTK